MARMVSRTIAITGAIEMATRAPGLLISVVTKRVYVRPGRMREMVPLTAGTDNMAAVAHTAVIALTATTAVMDAATITVGAITQPGGRLTMMAITAVTTRV